MGAQPARLTPSPVNGGARQAGDAGAGEAHAESASGQSSRPGSSFIPPLPPGAVARATLADRRRLKSLDRSLKTFLRLSNLPGLEYRLRLAGYYTVVDLLGATEEGLVARGFTPLMARRLLTALDDYIRRHVEIGPHVQFKMVRRGQKMRTEPSERVKAMPTYGKRNFKRQSSLPDGSWNSKGSRASSLSAPKTPARVRLMSDEVLNLQHFIQLPSATEGDQTQHLNQPSGVMEGDQTQHLNQPLGVMEGDQTQHLNQPLSAIEASDQTQEQDLTEGVDASQERLMGSDRTGGEELFDLGLRESLSPTSVNDTDPIMMSPSPVSPSSWSTMIRSSSIPADFRWTDMDAYNIEWFLHHRVRHYSCPPRLRSLKPRPLSDTKSAIDSLRDASDADSTFLALQQLVQDFRSPTVGGGVRRGGREAVEVVLGVMEHFCYAPKIVERSLRVLKHLTRRGELWYAVQMVYGAGVYGCSREGLHELP